MPILLRTESFVLKAPDASDKYSQAETAQEIPATTGNRLEQEPEVSVTKYGQLTSATAHCQPKLHLLALELTTVVTEKEPNNDLNS